MACTTGPETYEIPAPDRDWDKSACINIHIDLVCISQVHNPRYITSNSIAIQGRRKLFITGQFKLNPEH